MAKRKAGNGGVGGGPLVDVLLTVSVVAVAMIVAAYVWMPDFQRGVHALAADIERRLYGERD